MKNYIIRIGGGIAVRAIEYEEAFVDDNAAVKYSARNMRYYHPTYYNMMISRMNDEGVWVLVAELRAEVVTSVVAGLMYPRKPE